MEELYALTVVVGIRYLELIEKESRMMNSKLSSKNTSGVKEVSFDKRRKKWHACISVSKKRIDLGMFEDLDDATQARKTLSEE